MKQMPTATEGDVGWQLCCSAVADERRQIRDYSPGQKNNAIRSKCAPICLKFGFRDDLEMPNKH